MVTKNQINLIRQIKRKRNRRGKKLFIVEGKNQLTSFYPQIINCMKFIPHILMNLI